MAKQNPYDPTLLREGLDKEPLVPMNYKGPLWSTTCSMFGQGCVELFNDKFGLQSMNFLHVWPSIDRRGGEVTNVVTVASFDAASGNKDIWINGDKNANPNNGPKMITQYKNVRTSGAKFGTSDTWKKVIGGIAANFDNDGKIVIDSASAEQIRRDGRFRNFAYVEIDFFKLMALVLEIGNQDPYDFTIDFHQGALNSDGHEDCMMAVHKFVGKRKTNNFKYQKFDSTVMTEGLESMYGGGNGGRRRR